jgi:hypothetical protein
MAQHPDVCIGSEAALIEGLLLANSVEKGGLCRSRLSSVQKTHGFGVATQNLKQIGSGTVSDFNVSGRFSQAEIAERLFQHNRPQAAVQSRENRTVPFLQPPSFIHGDWSREAAMGRFSPPNAAHNDAGPSATWYRPP